MNETAIQNQAGYVYSVCFDAITVAPNGAQWDVFNGPGGSRVDTVDTAVLTELDNNYDLPVRLIDGSDWRTRPSTTDPADTWCHHEFPDRSLCAGTTGPDVPFCPSHTDDPDTEPLSFTDTGLPAPRPARRFPSPTATRQGDRS